MYFRVIMKTRCPQVLKVVTGDVKTGGAAASVPADETGISAESFKELQDSIKRLTKEHERLRNSQMDEQVARLKSLATSHPLPENQQMLQALGSACREAHARGHPMASLLAELYNRAQELTSTDVKVADMVRSALGDTEQDKVQAAVNKALKSAELRVKLQAAQVSAKKASMEVKSPLEKPYKSSTVSYATASQSTPSKKEREDVVCDLCSKKGHYMRKCPELEEAKKALAKPK